MQPLRTLNDPSSTLQEAFGAFRRELSSTALAAEQTIAVLREHVAFLQEMLRQREKHFQKRAEKTTQELESLRAENVRLRVALSAALEYISGLEYAVREEVECGLMNETIIRGWENLL